MPSQLLLPLQLANPRSFDSFYQGDRAPLLNAIKHALSIKSGTLYLWGASGSGRTHLLHAACNYVTQSGRTIAYVPLKKFQAFSPDYLDHLEQFSLSVLDDLQVVAGQVAWERAIFHLYNRVQETPGTVLLISGNRPPQQLGCVLPDLVSRLAWGGTYWIHPLREDEKLKALQLSASHLGIELPEDVAHFLLHRLPRDTHTLFSSLEKLDEASMKKHRRLTIPFVKGVLAL